tara:strand:- start:528 stop:695 length:168 start_codon:yes stop_codon:yes gene_type:complete
MKQTYHPIVVDKKIIKELIKEIRTVTDKECQVNNMKSSILRIADRLEDIINKKEK